MNPFPKNIDSDNGADDQITTCLNLEKPTSFFLFAGAGSGKTGSLIKALEHLKQKSGRSLRLKGQKIAVITYTNAACDEIKQRTNFDALIEVSTIHSFLWMMIKNFHNDIKQWLIVNIKKDILELEEQQRKGRAGTKAAIDRENSIISKTKRLSNLSEIKYFTYNPNGENYGRDSLNHSEVIKIGSDFLREKLLMQNLLVSKFPVLLIDESQDTNQHLMNALLKVQETLKDKFILGLFGDVMQKIYSDGKADLGQKLPDDWVKPAKIINHRCPKRIVELTNKIRSEVDDQKQQPRSDKDDGTVRLFVLPYNVEDKKTVEQNILQKMADITNDNSWNKNEIKILILEHHMAAKRMGFFDMYEPLYKIERFRTGLLDGTLSLIRFFSDLILPILKAHKNNNDFAIASIVRKKSPLLKKSALKAAKDGQINQLKKVKEAVESLTILVENNPNISFLELLQCVQKTGLFEIPEILRPIAIRTTDQDAIIENTDQNIIEEKSDNDEELDALNQFLLTPFNQIDFYHSYVTEKSSFATHQGIKGREFPRVAVIIDDNEAKGFLFSYDKLFGAIEKTKSDFTNESAGNDTSIDRTRRLFYVTCSRAEKSLAIIAYSANPQIVKEYAINRGWFKNAEVELMN